MDVEEMIKQGWAPIKQEFIVETSTEKDNPSEDAPSEAVNADRKADRRRHRGQDKQRDRKMANARAAVRTMKKRLCPSVVVPDKICRFGEKCNSEHSLEKFLEEKPPDLGTECPFYDQLGSCKFSFACRFGGAHTEGLQQLTKEVEPGYEPTMNSVSSHLFAEMRKCQYDLSPSNTALKSIEAPIGTMEREGPRKLDTRSLRGKRYLAPLTTVGNLPFRRLCVTLGAEITCSEMAVATSLLQGNPSEWSLIKRHPSEKIFGVQLAGGFPDCMTKATQIILDQASVDFIDINMGCPIDAVNDKGGGCALMYKPGRLAKLLAAMNGVMKDVPLTIKMRYGIKEGQRTSHALMQMFSEKSAVDLVTLHPRSKEQRYTKAAEWDYVPQCLDAIQGRYPLWICGDVLSPEDYYSRLEDHPIDGIMIGRGALIKPWIFHEIETRQLWDISSTERLEFYRQFVNFGLEHWGSDDSGVETTRRFMLEWLSFTHRYIPVGLLEVLPPRFNLRPPTYRGRNELETLMASPKSSDWVTITEMFLGKVPDGFLFIPKHKANAY